MTPDRKEIEYLKLSLWKIKMELDSLKEALTFSSNLDRIFLKARDIQAITQELEPKERE